MTALAQQPADESAESTVLVVPGMHCAGCMAKVERSLSAVPGVSHARVNLTARQVRVDHAANVTTPELVEALAGAGENLRAGVAGYLAGRVRPGGIADDR